MNKKDKENKTAFRLFEQLAGFLINKYPEIYFEFMTTCRICGRRFRHAYDNISGKISDTLWEPDCDCIPGHPILAVGGKKNEQKKD